MTSYQSRAMYDIISCRVYLSITRGLYNNIIRNAIKYYALYWTGGGGELYV